MSARRIPLMQPMLPTADDLLPYLRRIDENRWYSNSGPLLREFQARLAHAFGTAEGSIVLAANGTLALQLALTATARPGRQKCLMPAWTFAATPLASMQAGLEPHFADIDPATWALSPDAVMARHDLDDLALIVPVAPFGHPPDVAAWNRVMDQTGVPVVIDAAAGFHGLAHAQSAPAATMPIMVSLHATKPLGIGEGGLILTNDEELAARLDRLRSFGFGDRAVLDAAGTNAKLSEYHAAVGLAALDAWPNKRSALVKAHTRYASNIRCMTGIGLMGGFSADWTSTTFNILTEEPAAAVIARFATHNIEARSWWGPGCHRHPALSDLPSDPLPYTDALAPHVLGLPMSPDMSDADIDRVCALLRAG
ncbi:DegT/DnrJ/EryC1/StrS family aminotransferase [Pyruvatibacter mobilis]|uniref:DegT/DnrJ/EryC1/StrS family aminotransferase n=1 Tax=Pyruvatibacter mobilis TaxID=1712261 RepID=UPI003BAA26AD